jgi:uncharacterized membrane protein
MAVSCAYCGTSMPDISGFCPSCGRPVARQAPPGAATTGNTRGEPRDHSPPLQAAVPAPGTPPVGLGDRLVGALAYFSLVPALVFLFMKPYQSRRFVRFHAWQSVLFWGLVLVLLLLGLLGSTFGSLFVWFLLGGLVGLAVFFTWGVLTTKALQGEWFRLPGVEKLAEPWLKSRGWL